MAAPTSSSRAPLWRSGSLRSKVDHPQAGFVGPSHWMADNLGQHLATRVITNKRSRKVAQDQVLIESVHLNYRNDHAPC